MNIISIMSVFIQFEFCFENRQIRCTISCRTITLHQNVFMYSRFFGIFLLSAVLTQNIERFDWLRRAKIISKLASRPGVGKLFARRARFEKTVQAAGRTLIGKQGEDFFLRSWSTCECDLHKKRSSPRFFISILHR